MSTSVYFNNFQNSQEQQLIEDLVVESISHYGHDVYYIPKTIVDFDPIYGEDPISVYSNPYFVDMYIKNVEGFAGDGDFLSKFNIQIRDQITFTVARRQFQNEVGAYAEISRPREGDLIYFPLNGKLFQIKFVEHEAIFYQLGSLQTYDIRCELFEYSGERLETGIDIIDNLEKTYSTSMDNYDILTDADLVITDSDGYAIIQSAYNLETQTGDSFSDSDEIQEEADDIIDWTALDPFSEGNV